MEHSGRNRWQPVTSGAPPKTARTEGITGSSPRGHDQRSARGRLEAGRPVRACRQGHLHRHREHNRRDSPTADACCYEAEANADSQKGTGGKGDEPDANEARGLEAIKLTLATSATPAGAASAALAPRAGGRTSAASQRLRLCRREGRHAGAAQRGVVRAHRATVRSSARSPTGCRSRSAPPSGVSYGERHARNRRHCGHPRARRPGDPLAHPAG
jgi:hypothetical protein